MKLGTLVRVTDIADVPAAFRKLRENGFETCQLVYKPEKYVPEDAERIKNAAAAEHIDICAQFLGFRDHCCLWDLRYGPITSGFSDASCRMERLEYALSGLDFLSWLGLRRAIVHAGFVSPNVFSPEYGALVSALKILADKAKGLGIDLLFETGQETPVQLLRLIRDVGTDNLYVNLDTANWILYGNGNPVDGMYTIGHLVRCVHAKDGLPPTQPDSLGKEVPLGQGFAHMSEVLSLLRERGYDGELVIEREIAGPEQTKDILAARDYLRAWIKEHA